MSLVILGGLDRLKRDYTNTGKKFGFRVKTFSQRVPDFAKRLRNVGAIVLFTGRVSHAMANDVFRIARELNIPLVRIKNSGVSGLEDGLKELAVS